MSAANDKITPPALPLTSLAKPQQSDQVILTSKEDLQHCEAEDLIYKEQIQAYGVLLLVDVRSHRVHKCSANAAARFQLPGLRPGVVLSELWPEVAAVLETAKDKARPETLSFVGQMAAADGSYWEVVAHYPQASEAASEVVSEVVLECIPSDPEADNADLLINFSEALERIRSPESMRAFLSVASQTIQQFLGYQRVMLYRFAEDWSGEVIAEAVAAGEPQRFIGLHFPASDIPPQARALYTRNLLRIIADVEAPSCSLLSSPEVTEPLDQSFALLRMPSPFHIDYLRNMGVKATLTISLIVEGKLWGMLACHHHQPKLPPFHHRQAALSATRLLGLVLTTKFEALARVEVLEQQHSFQQELATLRSALEGCGDDEEFWGGVYSFVMRTFEVRSAGIVLEDTSYGSCLNEEGLLALREYFLEHSSIQATETLRELPWLRQGMRHTDSAGLLLIPLSQFPGSGLVLERPVWLHSVHWAGRPDSYTPVSRDGEHVVLGARNSFATWEQEVRDRCEPWPHAYLAMAAELARVLETLYGHFMLRKQQRALNTLAYHDVLTGLYNRHALLTRLSKVDKEALRLGYWYAVLFFDFDQFKALNDNFGHYTGDTLLQQVAARLRAESRENDIIARNGSDEFVLIRSALRADDSGIAAAHKLARYLQQCLAEPYILAGVHYRIGCSVGIAIGGQQADYTGDLLRQASMAMFIVKQRGGNSCLFFDRDMQQRMQYLHELEQELIVAIECQSLALHYQPIVDSERQVVAYEALLRWFHPSRGVISPADFIPLAEQSRLIISLGTWVLRSACQQLAQWADDPERQALSIAVNVSARQIQEKDFVATLQQLLEETGAPVQQLKLEITESLIQADVDTTITTMRALKALGLRFSLDDFGTGYSSLSYLQKLPLDEVKIDKHFIQHALHNPRDAAIVTMVIQLAQTLNLAVVAEGIEDEAQWQWLQTQGCNYFQGYLFGKASAL